MGWCSEAAISLLSFGHTAHTPPASPAVSPLLLPTVQLSKYEVSYPRIGALHQESPLSMSQEVMEWRNQPELTLPTPVLSTQPLIPLQPAIPSELPTTTVEDVIRRRGSTRRFTHEPITFTQLSTILTSSRHSIPTDGLRSGAAPLGSLYLIANAVENLENGTYVFHQEQQALERLQTGTFRQAAQILALGQDLAVMPQSTSTS